MNVKQFFGHPIVSNLLVTFFATVLAYKAIQYFEKKALEKKETSKLPKQTTKIPVPETVTTVSPQYAQEVTSTNVQ